MKIQQLIEKFNSFDEKLLSEYEDLISSKDDNGIFPPYVPYKGDKYDSYKILMYGMAQNINTPWKKLSNKTHVAKVRQMYDAKSYKDIAIAPYKIMLSVAGIYLFAKYGKYIEMFEDIHRYISVSNYYKFSLNVGNKKKDINPNNKKLPSNRDPNNYWSINDNLSKEEISCLDPDVIITFNGRHNKVIRDCGYKLIKINDPSWVLRGGSGVLKETGSWYRNIENEEVIELTESYLKQIDDKYKKKKEAVKIYLLKYYDDWS